MGAAPDAATSAIRFSLGKQTTEAEIEETSRIVARVISRLSASERNAASESYAVV